MCVICAGTMYILKCTVYIESYHRSHSLIHVYIVESQNETLTVSDLGVDISPCLKVTSVQDPPVREAGSKVVDVDEPVSKLKDASVI